MTENTMRLLIGEPFHARMSPGNDELRLGGTGFVGGQEMKMELVVPAEALREYRRLLRALLDHLEKVELPASTTSRRQ